MVRGRVRQIREEIQTHDDGAVIMILASLTSPQGHDALPRAIGRLKDERPGLRCAIVGDGPCRGQLEKQARELGIERQVTFAGYQRNVSDYLAASDLLVSSSRDNAGCSNSILKAMVAGTPMIATDIGENRELVTDNVTRYLVPVSDDAHFASTIDLALDQSGLTWSIAQWARHMVTERFGLTSMIREYEQLYLRYAADATALSPAHEEPV